MIDHLTVIPADSIITANGEALCFSFQAPDKLHALQWHNGKGHIEYTDSTPNRALVSTDYIKEIAPFVAFWRGEKRRLEEDTKELPTLEEVHDEALEQIKAKRIAVEYAGSSLKVDGKTFFLSSNIKNETRLNSLEDLFMRDPTIQIPDWKLADGVYVTMNAPLLQLVKTAMFTHVVATFEVERHKRKEVEALQTTEEVFSWMETELDTGWPI